MVQQDAIVDIPPNRVKFFGTTGKMLMMSGFEEIFFCLGTVTEAGLSF